MPSRPARLAIYLSSHGFGHTTRTAVVLEELIRDIDCELYVRASTPRRLWPASLEAVTRSWVAERCDAGVIQTSDIEVDQVATGREIEAWARGHDDAVREEAQRLESAAIDLVIGDVPPLAFDAAAAAGIASVAVANFSWDWIYEAMGFADAAGVAARAYATAERLIELEPFAPMDAFRERRSVGIIGRSSPRDRDPVRAELGVDPSRRLVLIAFREPSAGMLALPPPVDDVSFVFPSAVAARPDVITAPDSMSFWDLMCASDCVLAKPGYGIIGDTAVTGTRLLYTERPAFPEDVVLRKWLSGREGAAAVAPDRLRDGSWGEEMAALLESPAPVAVGDSGVKRAAAEIEDSLAAARADSG